MRQKKVPTEKNKYHVLTIIYLSAFFITLIVYSHAILDYTLLPRFLALSLGIIAFSITSFNIIENRLSINFNILTVSLLGFYILNFLSALWANNISEVFFESQKYFLNIMVFFITIFLMKNTNNFFPGLLKIMLLVSIIAEAIGLYQFIILTDYSVDSLYSITSLYAHKNLFSCFLFLLVIFNGVAYLHFESYWKKLHLIAAIIGTMLIIALQTRAVWVGGTIALISFSSIYLVSVKEIRIQKVGLSLLIIISIISIPIGFLSYKGELTTMAYRANISKYTQSGNARERFAVWDKTIHLIKDNFWIGKGAGNWQTSYAKYTVKGIFSVEGGNNTFQRPHNDFLWIFSESGFIGILLIMTFYLCIIFYSLRLYFIVREPQKKKIILTFLSGFIGFLIISFFDFPKERIDIMLVIFTLLGILYVYISEQITIPSFWKPKTNKKFIFLLIIPLLALNIVIAYFRIKGEYNSKKLYTYRDKQDWQKVIKYADKSVSFFYKIDPTSIPVAWYRGLANFSLQNNKQAYNDFKNAYNLNPYNHHVLNNFATASEVIGERNQSKALYLEALRINPKFDDALLNLAAVYYNEQNYEEALKWTMLAKDSEPRKKIYMNTILPLMKNK